MREGVRLASRADAWVAAGLLRRADRLPHLVDQIIVRRKPATVWLADCVVGHGLLDLDRGTVPHERRDTGPSSSMRPTSTQTARPTVLRPSSASDDQRSLQQGDDHPLRALLATPPGPSGQHAGVTRIGVTESRTIAGAALLPSLRRRVHLHGSGRAQERVLTTESTETSGRVAVAGRVRIAAGRDR